MQCKDNSVRDQYLISSTSVGKRGWTLEALVNKSTILARTKSLASILLIVELVVLIGVIAMIAYLFRGMLGNILALDKSFRDINAGNHRWRLAFCMPRGRGAILTRFQLIPAAV